MPKYEVYIPASAASEFEGKVRQLGGFIGKREQTRAELLELFTPQWQQEVQEARDLLQRLQDPHSPEANMLIFQGMTALLGSVLPINELKKDIDWGKARDRLATLLSSFLTDEIPQGVSVQKGQVSYFLRPKHDYYAHPLVPRDVSFTLLHYGLSGEKAIPIEELARRFAISADVIRNKIGHAQRVIIKSSEDFW